MHLLDVAPYLVIDRIKVGAIRRPQIWIGMKAGVDCSKTRKCRMPGVQERYLVEK